MRARQAKGLNKAASLWTTLSNFQMPHRHLRDKAIGKEFLSRLARFVVAAPLRWNALTCKQPVAISAQLDGSINLLVY
jgi:hypothetical protein